MKSEDAAAFVQALLHAKQMWPSTRGLKEGIGELGKAA
jgi:hypothetical protein